MTFFPFVKAFGKASRLGPFRHAAFAVIWTATVVSNVGSWMYDAASAWLMTTLDPSPLIVSLVQVAATLPMFLFALPAGALADIVDKRRLLLVVEGATTVAAALFAAIVWFGLANPLNVLFFTFLIGVGTAVGTPAWQAITPLLVPRPDLPAAIAANSVGINISRAIGPALGGALTVRAGIVAPFWINAVSNLGVLAALAWWRPPAAGKSTLPSEQFLAAVRAGFRYAAHNPDLTATLIRAAAFFMFASAYWALLPLMTRTEIGGGADLYGVLVGAIGAGAVGGAFFLPALKKRLGGNGVVAVASVATAVSLFLYAVSVTPGPALLASLLAGASWIAVVATLNTSAQLSVPEWVRARGLAIFVTVFFGFMTLGSALWGEVASLVGLPAAHFIAAGGMVAAIPLTMRWRLREHSGSDLAPSMHWAAPMISHEIGRDRGPVLVVVEYRVDEANRAAFLRAVRTLSQERRRDGAYRWGIYEDTADQGRFIEAFLVESWLEHLRQHERVTNADRVVQDELVKLTNVPPKVSHLIAPSE